MVSGTSFRVARVLVPQESLGEGEALSLQSGNLSAALLRFAPVQATSLGHTGRKRVGILLPAMVEIASVEVLILRGEET